MIRAFLDESEYGDRFLVAGWVADYKTWERFSEDWRSVLDSEPAIRYFKHHEAKSDPPRGEFAGWTREQVETKISALVDVVCRHEMYGVASGLNAATHDAAFSSSVATRKQIRSVLKVIHHYQACVFSISAMVLNLQINRGQTDMVDFVFDKMGELLGQCIAKYDEFKEHFEPDKKAIAGSMTEADDKDVEALQAADLLVGQLTTRLRLGHAEEHFRRMHKAHDIFFSQAYWPSFEKIPEFMSLVDLAWSGLQLARAAVKRKPDPPPSRESIAPRPLDEPDQTVKDAERDGHNNHIEQPDE